MVSSASGSLRRPFHPLTVLCGLNRISRLPSAARAAPQFALPDLRSTDPACWPPGWVFAPRLSSSSRPRMREPPVEPLPRYLLARRARPCGPALTSGLSDRNLSTRSRTAVALARTPACQDFPEKLFGSPGSVVRSTESSLLISRLAPFHQLAVRQSFRPASPLVG